MRNEALVNGSNLRRRGFIEMRGWQNKRKFHKLKVAEICAKYNNEGSVIKRNDVSGDKL